MDWSTAQHEVRDEAGDEEQEHKVHGRESWQEWAGYDFPGDEFALPMQEELEVLEPWSESDKEPAKMISITLADIPTGLEPGPCKGSV